MVERQRVICMMKRLCVCKKYKKIHRIVAFLWMMYVNGRKSKYIFQKIHYNKYVFRATSEKKLVTLFLIKNVYRNESKNTLAYIYLLV